MTKDKIIELLTELGQRLCHKGIQGEMYVVGGAAMALAYDAGGATRDIDAALNIIESVYRDHRIPARAQFLLEEIFLSRQ